METLTITNAEMIKLAKEQGIKDFSAYTCNDLYFYVGDADIRKIGHLPNCKKIHIYNSNVESIESAPACVEFDAECSELTAVPDLPECKIVNVSGASIKTPITKIGKLPKCTHLSCAHTTIAELPELPKCRELRCQGTQIKTLPYMPKLKLLLAPKLSFTTNVFRDQSIDYLKSIGITPTWK